MVAERRQVFVLLTQVSSKGGWKSHKHLAQGKRSDTFYARGWEAMLEPMHSLVTNCSVVEACVQVRAEGPMEHGAQGKRSDTLGITCWSSRALKGQKHYNVL